MSSNLKPCSVEVIFFDFGGVLAEEGFRNGLVSIAKRNGLDPQVFVKAAFNLVFEGGFVVGRSDEETFWQSLREQFGIKGSDSVLRREVLSRFELRPWMMELIKNLRDHNVRLVILSDQTHWLDELEARHGFFKWFDRIFNSYHMGKSKKDPSIFDDVVAEMGIEPTQALFVDDNMGNIQRARERGLHAILYQDRERFQNELSQFCRFLAR